MSCHDKPSLASHLSKPSVADRGRAGAERAGAGRTSIASLEINSFASAMHCFALHSFMVVLFVILGTLLLWRVREGLTRLIAVASSVFDRIHGRARASRPFFFLLFSFVVVAVVAAAAVLSHRNLLLPFVQKVVWKQSKHRMLHTGMFLYWVTNN